MIGLNGATASHVGQVRDVNQDRAFYANTFAAVADGMGGHAGGEVASSLAIAEISGIRRALSVSGFHRVIEAANQRIYDAAIKPELRGMGTTLVAAILDAENGLVHLLNVGDSRGYLIREGEISQITVDHSLVEDLLRQGSIEPEEALNHPQRNIVTRALGISDHVTVDMFAVEAHEGDRFVLCSDGLSNEVDDEGIAAIASSYDSPKDAAEALVAAAVEAGGKDNVTVAVLIVTDDGVTPPPLMVRSKLDEEANQVAEEDDGAPTEVGIQPIRVTASTATVGTASTESKRSFPWRGAALAAAVAVVLGLATLATSWYATSAYFVDEEAGEVVILHGRPGGLLFWEPTVEEKTGIDSSLLDGASVERVKAQTVWSSLEEAQALVDLLVVVDPKPAEG